MAADEQPLRLSPALLPPPVDLLVNDQEEEEVENEDIPAPAAPSPFASGGFDIDSFTRDHLHCPSCGKYYDDPRTLPCLDSYCRECLEEKTREQMEEAEREREREGEENRESEDSDKEYNEALRTFDLSPCPSSTTGSTMSQRSARNDDFDPVSRSNDFHCPQGCRRYTGIKFDPQDGSISGIPPSNKSLKNMVQGVQLHEGLKAGEILCGGCDKEKPAIAACSNPKCANLPLCSECVGSHLTTSEPESHLLICVNKGGEGNNKNGKKRNLRNGWRCEFHPDEVVDRYCYKHKVVICRDCHLCPQRECTPDCNNFTLLSQDCMKDEEPAIAELLDRVNSLHDKIKYSIKDIDTMKKELRKNKKWAYRAIDEQYKKLVDSLRQQRRDLINKTYHVYKRKWDNLKDHQDALKRISDTFQRSVDFIGGSVNMAIPTEFMFLKESFHEGLNYLIDRYKNSYMLPSDVNQRIHLKLNDTFSIDGGTLGQVVGTPFIENYTLESFPNPVRSQRAYSFKIQSRDICRTEVAGNVPMLKATICSIASLEPVECFVRLNNEEGVYTVYFHPFTAGRHMISVFRHQDPLEGIPVRGCPFYIDVKP
ncbi:PREDICTED: E3 ubiquitin-protein ligase TRIM9-like [Amphimedon queenslandica]|uniref:B-box C-terminal domain-containing protein n=1 Tax=Amphimedon queenslandica TaxID=400682 RepID=A0AAN0IMF9_AMPQE|nr:PREDICTED: E3 ubiquitin-protein ligase TRIM9-like [Amphimedon queenslandica]|eukprot:XP_011404689.1 PREDICTED: E3 ubiquitin-protein ligase TRIM9-like [Amphimedon queenslandica]